MDSLTVDVVIGLVFVFATFAALVAVLTELFSRFLGLRGEYLLRGIRSLLDGPSDFELTDLGVKSFVDRFRSLPEVRKQSEPESQSAGDAAQTSDAAPQGEQPAKAWVTDLMNHPLVQPSADNGEMPPLAGNAKLRRSERRKLPSYLTSKAFSQALVGLLVPDAKGDTKIEEIRAAVEKLPDSAYLKKSLVALLAAAGNGVDTFRTALEQWYDNQMARVSGWYKRHVRWISLAIGAVLVLAFNVNALTIARAVYTDEALRESVVTQAVAASDCGTKSPAECLAAARDHIAQARSAGLPLGWGAVADCLATDQGNTCSGPERFGLADAGSNGLADLRFLGLVLVGYAAMLLALLPGARFWFDLLSRLGSLRSTGPKPDST